ncbi:MAG: TAXI family TRAP transporter solute-binding subunit [Spirochaetes bacterium]|nr:TAXI family TRAP transporter solute-binding subunit [Spirochaetota bacterium]
MKKVLILILCCCLVFGFATSCKKSDTAQSTGTGKTFVTIGTGGVTGVYYPAGGAISKIVNKKYDEYKLKVTVESTGGSVFNVNAIMAGDLEFGIVQSDRQAQAFNGEAEWKDKGKQTDLRSVCALHPESVTLLAADDAGIKTIMDLKGKKVNIGNPGSGNRGNAIDALTNAGLDWENDLKAEQLKASEAAKMLQDDRIDAYFYTVGHPSGSFKEATAGRRKVHFVPIENIDDLLNKYSYYAASYIPIKHYPNATNDADVPTYGVKATFCTSAKVSEDIVYVITKEIFENLNDFKALHPAFEILTKESMLEGLTAPLHPGAEKYFKEVGLK